jgi:hypothetical protein
VVLFKVFELYSFLNRTPDFVDRDFSKLTAAGEYQYTLSLVIPSPKTTKGLNDLVDKELMSNSH